MEALRETLLMAGQDLRQALRSSKAWTFLAVFAVLTLLVGSAVTWSSTQFEALTDTSLANAPGGAEQQRQETLMALLSGVTGDPERARYYLSIPAVVLFFFWAARVGLPLLVALMSFDQISGEMQVRSLRYVTLRSGRGPLVAGKILSHLALVAGMTLVTDLLLVAFTAALDPGFAWANGLLHMGRVWLLTLPIAACCLALTSLMSALFRPPLMSLAATLAALVGMLTLWAVSVWVPGTAGMRWLVPWHYNHFLTSPAATDQLLGAVAYLGFGAVFALLSWATVRAKDI